MSANFADWVAICETKARYCRCLDTKDWGGYADVCTEDLILDTSAAASASYIRARTNGGSRPGCTH
jgi:hypothetical protein